MSYPVSNQLRGEAVAQGVTRGVFPDPAAKHRLLDRPLHHALVQVMPPPSAGCLVHVVPHRRKDPLPRPLPRRTGILGRQRARELDVARPPRHIPPVTAPHYLEVRPQRLEHRVRDTG